MTNAQKTLQVEPLRIEQEKTPSPVDRKELRRNEVIDAAIAVFAREGFAQATMDDVAREAGIAKGTVYLYFKSKEDLFRGAIESRLVPFAERAQASVADLSGSAAELLKNHIRLAYEQIIAGDLKHILRLVIAEGPRFPEIKQFYYDNVLMRLTKGAISKIIDYGVERGEFSPISHDQIALIVMGPAMIAGMWKIVWDDLDPIDLDTYFQTHLEVILSGVLAKDS